MSILTETFDLTEIQQASKTEIISGSGTFLFFCGAKKVMFIIVGTSKNSKTLDI